MNTGNGNGNGNGTGQIVNKAWSYAHVLRDDGLSYLAYTEQTILILCRQYHSRLCRWV